MRILAPPQNQVNQTPSAYPLHFPLSLRGGNSGRGLGKVERINRGYLVHLILRGCENPIFYTTTIDNRNRLKCYENVTVNGCQSNVVSNTIIIILLEKLCLRVLNTTITPPVPISYHYLTIHYIQWSRILFYAIYSFFTGQVTILFLQGALDAT